MSPLSASVSIIALLAGLAASAHAADLPSIKVPPAPVPNGSVAPTWTGFYFGGHAGVAWNQYEAEVTTGTVKATTVTNVNLHGSGALLGIHAGYNYQFGSVVVGVEVDASSTPALRTTKPIGIGSLQNGSMAGVASLRGRLGVALDSTLIYATGGVGVVFDSFSNDDFSTQRNERFVGVVGGGVEHRVGRNLSVGIESLYFASGHSETVVNSTATRKATFGSGNVGVVRGKISYNW